MQTQHSRQLRIVQIIIALAAIALIGSSAFAQQKFALAGYETDGGLDTTFGTGGKVATDFPNSTNAAASAIAIVQWGWYSSKIVVAGTVDNQFALARYYPDGSLDTTFGDSGRVLTSFSDSAKAKALAIDSIGRIVVAGEAGGRVTLARYDSAGNLDTTFGGGGAVQISFSGSFASEANAVAIDASGKIVVAGMVTQPSIPEDHMFALARFNENGSLDTTFNRDGRVTTNYAENTETHYDDLEEANAVAIDANGKIMVAGQFLYAVEGANWSYSKWVVLRYLPNGSLDSSFSGDGYNDSAFVTEYHDNQEVYQVESAPYAAAIDQSGRFVVAGRATGGGLKHFALARYTTNGALDTTFDGDGKVTTNFGWVSSEARAIKIDGTKILLAGRSGYNNSFSVFGLARYNANGSLDTSFDGDGRVITDFTCQGPEEANAIATHLVSFGSIRIVTAGWASGDPCQ